MRTLLSLICVYLVGGCLGALEAVAVAQSSSRGDSAGELRGQSRYQSACAEANPLQPMPSGARARFYLRRDGTAVDRGERGNHWGVEVERTHSWMGDAQDRADSTVILRVEEWVGASTVGTHWCAILPTYGAGRAAYRLPDHRTSEGHILALTLLDEPRRPEARRARQTAIERVEVWTARQVLSDEHGLITDRLTAQIRAADFDGARTLASSARGRARELTRGWPCRRRRGARDRLLRGLVCSRVDTYAQKLDRLLSALRARNQADARTSLAAIDVPAGTADADQSPIEVLRYYLRPRSEMLRLVPVARFEIPLAPDDRLFSVSLSEAERAERRLHGGERIALLVFDVPAGMTLASRRLRGPSLRSDPAKLFARFITYVVGAGRTQGSGESAQIDRGFAPLARIGTRAVWAPRVEAGVRNDYLLCRGRTCVTEGDARNVATTLRVSPEDTWQLTVLVAAGAITVPRFGNGNLRTELRRDYGVMGDDVVWELTPRSDLFLPHLALHLGFRIHDFFIGLGPSVLLVDSDPLRHWQLALGGRLPGDARGIYVLGHVGFLLHDRPVDAVIGDRYEIPPPESGEPSAPELQTETEAAFTMGLSVAVDLEGIGSAAEGLVGLFGGE